MRPELPRLDGVACGFFGKIPARGDFVRFGLPASFTAPWDAWMSGVLAASQPRLGATWRDAWMQAPIWCFELQAGMCGPAAAIGLWMPSIDRAGRDYPLTIAAVMPSGTTAPAGALAAVSGAFLNAAQAAGLEALDADLSPDELGARVVAASRLAPTPVSGVEALAGRALWWTEGSPFVPKIAFALPDLPTEDGFARMLDARMLDGGMLDAGMLDAGMLDAGMLDAGSTEAVA